MYLYYFLIIPNVDSRHGKESTKFSTERSERNRKERTKYKRGDDINASLLAKTEILKSNKYRIVNIWEVF